MCVWYACTVVIEGTVQTYNGVARFLNPGANSDGLHLISKQAVTTSIELVTEELPLPTSFPKIFTISNQNVNNHIPKL